MRKRLQEPNCPARVLTLACFAANTILFFYFAAPLSTMLHVLRSRDSASLVLPLCVMNTINGVLWLIYGMVLSDPFIWVPNGAGTALGGLQIGLRLLIPRKDLKCASTLFPLRIYSGFFSRCVRKAARVQSLMLLCFLVASLASSLFEPRGVCTALHC